MWINPLRYRYIYPIFFFVSGLESFEETEAILSV